MLAFAIRFNALGDTASFFFILVFVQSNHLNNGHARNNAQDLSQEYSGAEYSHTASACSAGEDAR